MYDILFDNMQIGNIKVKNRLVMSPMGSGLAQLDGTPGEDMLAYFEARAIGGAGIIIPEICRVNDATGAGMLRQLSATKDRHIKGLAQIANVCHKHGAKVIIQLHHPGREGVSALIGGEPCVSASDKMCNVSRQKTRPMTIEEIKELIVQFGDAALRCKKAGIDGVELHCAHGYLLQQFLSPYTNLRTDEYGGSFENRFRIVKEIIAEIRKRCGDDYVLGARLSVDEMLTKMGVKEDHIKLEDGIEISKALEKEGIDFLDVSCGLYESGAFSIEPCSFPEGWRKPMIKAVRDAVKLPIIAVCNTRGPEMAEELVKDGVVDFVSFGRPWLADPEWGKKVQEGRVCELRKCINCLRCFETLMKWNGKAVPFECAVNPVMGRELRFGKLDPVEGDKKVVVVGGGPGGMYAAKVLAERGVSVTLLDRGKELGGTINLAKLPPLKDKMQAFNDYMANELDRLGVEVKLNTEAKAEDIIKMAPDQVVLATGSKSIVPSSIPGIDGANVCVVEDVLTGKVDLTGKKVALIGAGLTGLETAEFLGEKGINVTVVDMVKKPAPQAYITNVLDIMGRIKKMDVTMMLLHSLKEIKADKVVVESVETQEVKDVPCDAVVLSLGNKPDTSLKEALEEAKIPVTLVGSAIKDGTIAPATKTGYETGMNMFREAEPSFAISPNKLKKWSRVNNMNAQEGVYLCYATDPEAIKAVLPAPLKPYEVPIVNLSIMHVHKPTFADDYYETILGVYCYDKEGRLGMYYVALILGGNGQEMATYLGRDGLAIPKKLDGEFYIRKYDDKLKITVSRRGAQIINLDMDINGEYNHPMAHTVYGAPAAGKAVPALGYFANFDIFAREDKPGNTFSNVGIIGAELSYEYKSWEPAFVNSFQMNSSEDDPWGCLPIRTVIGGAYNTNDLIIKQSFLEHKYDQPYGLLLKVMPAFYDNTAFMQVGRI